MSSNSWGRIKFSSNACCNSCRTYKINISLPQKLGPSRLDTCMRPKALWEPDEDPALHRENTAKNLKIGQMLQALNTFATGRRPVLHCENTASQKPCPHLKNAGRENEDEEHIQHPQSCRRVFPVVRVEHLRHIAERLPCARILLPLPRPPPAFRRLCGRRHRGSS